MTGFDLMLMGICIISNTTNCDRNHSLLIYDDAKYYGEFDLDKMDLSTATKNLKPKDEILLPKVMKITTLDMPPYSSIYKLNGKTMGNVTSLAFYIFDLISKKLNIEYEIVMPEQEILGDHTKGVIGLLHEKKVDMAVAFLPMHPDMYRYVSFSPILTQIKLKAMMKRSDILAVRSGLLAPFTNQVWILIIIAVIISGPIFFGIVFLRSYLWKNSKTDNYTFLQCAWFTYGAILKQGSTISPKTDSNRVLFASWWIFIIILTSFYYASLNKFLYSSKLTLPYHSIADIVNDNQKWLATSERYIDFALKQSEIEDLKILKTSFENDQGRFITKPSDREILKIMDSDDEAKIYLGEDNHLQRMIADHYLKMVRKNKPQNKRCKYVIMPEIIYQQPVAFAYPKDSPYQEKFDKQLRNLVQFGIIKYLEQRKLPLVPYCPLNLNEVKLKLNINDLSLAFKILAGGLTLATLTFIYEKTGVHQKNTIKKICSYIFPNFKIWKNRHNRKRVLAKNPTQILPLVCRVNNYFDDQPSTSNPSPTRQSVGMNKKIIYNGREYLEIDTPRRTSKRLIPTRSLSALLFQYNE
ncbi:glutamate receptor U1-like [Aphidius gifuensis]|uniref:glutamate receptor U1-like n=1 Tax=Aphidius gifuensis TaxID=684658 RepID=UPI001CDCDA34|nr:glutamate receptor U1-like [Aphidius gifuensis]